MGTKAANGSHNLTMLVAPGTIKGRHAADGSANAVIAPGGSYVGAHHPSGAMWVTKVTVTSPIRAADGSLNVNVINQHGAGERVTAVSGVL